MSARETAMEDPNPSTENGFPAKNSNNFESLWIPTSSSVFFTDSSSGFDTEKKIDGKSDIGRPEKKRRLKPDQVRVLEEIFEVENKLESCRKQQLAEELGLHPRQIAIWFQNRRARCKSKVLEKEYDALKAKYDKLKADHDAIFAKNQELRNQVHQLTQKLGKRRIGVEPITAEEETFTPDPPTKTSSPAAAASSVKSDVIDSESSSPSLFDKLEYLKPDFSDESMSFLQPFLSFPKIEGGNCEDLQPNSCNLGFPVQHQGTWLWRY